MKKLSLVFATFLFISCYKTNLESKEVYSQKANELIFQVALKSNCECMLEVPTESFLAFDSLVNSPKLLTERKNGAIKKLNLGKEANLNDAIRLSENFKLDSNKIESKGIRIINENELYNLHTKTDLEAENKCKGVIMIYKPIFNRGFNKALLKFDFAFTHISNKPTMFELKNGKWLIVD